jgi:hypothetical protein
MTTVERNAVSLLISAEDSREVAERIADFVDRFHRLPTLGELPAFYCYALENRQQFFDMLHKQFIVECESGKPLRLLFFTNP